MNSASVAANAAAVSASQASTKASEAAASASSASMSATNAAGSATAALASANTAATQASNASVSAVAAAASAASIVGDASAAARSAASAANTLSLVQVTVANHPGRNKILNGKMEVAQRGVNFAAIASGAYSLDRWVFGNTSTAVLTISQQTGGPIAELPNSLRVAVNTADTIIVASDLCRVSQRIEGFYVRELTGRTFTLSFWVRSSKVGTHCVVDSFPKLSHFETRSR
jgi:hypothetical protein